MQKQLCNYIIWREGQGKSDQWEGVTCKKKIDPQPSVKIFLCLYLNTNAQMILFSPVDEQKLCHYVLKFHNRVSWSIIYCTKHSLILSQSGSTYPPISGGFSSVMFLLFLCFLMSFGPPIHILDLLCQSFNFLFCHIFYLFVFCCLGDSFGLKTLLFIFSFLWLYCEYPRRFFFGI